MISARCHHLFILQNDQKYDESWVHQIHTVVLVESWACGRARRGGEMVSDVCEDSPRGRRGGSEDVELRRPTPFVVPKWEGGRTGEASARGVNAGPDRGRSRKWTLGAPQSARRNQHHRRQPPKPPLKPGFPTTRSLRRHMRLHLNFNPHVVLPQPLHAHTRPQRLMPRHPLLKPLLHGLQGLVVEGQMVRVDTKDL